MSAPLRPTPPQKKGQEIREHRAALDPKGELGARSTSQLARVRATVACSGIGEVEKHDGALASK